MPACWIWSLSCYLQPQTAEVIITLCRFAYIEFSDKESVRTSLALDESLFRGRQIKVSPVLIAVLVLCCKVSRLTLRLSVVHPSLSGDPKTNQQTRHQHNRPGFPKSPIPCPDHQLQQFPLSILQWFQQQAPGSRLQVRIDGLLLSPASHEPCMLPSFLI